MFASSSVPWIPKERRFWKRWFLLLDSRRQMTKSVNVFEKSKLDTINNHKRWLISSLKLTMGGKYRGGSGRFQINMPGGSIGSLQDIPEEEKQHRLAREIQLIYDLDWRCEHLWNICWSCLDLCGDFLDIIGSDLASFGSFFGSFRMLLFPGSSGFVHTGLPSLSATWSMAKRLSQGLLKNT